jgi:hypothetical protein
LREYTANEIADVNLSNLYIVARHPEITEVKHTAETRNRNLDIVCNIADSGNFWYGTPKLGQCQQRNRTDDQSAAGVFFRLTASLPRALGRRRSRCRYDWPGQLSPP